MHVCRVHCDRVIDFDQGLVCFSLGRDDSDVVATGVNYAVASSSSLSESICNLVIPPEMAIERITFQMFPNGWLKYQIIHRW